MNEIFLEMVKCVNDGFEVSLRQGPSEGFVTVTLSRTLMTVSDGPIIQDFIFPKGLVKSPDELNEYVVKAIEFVRNGGVI